MRFRRNKDDEPQAEVAEDASETPASDVVEPEAVGESAETVADPAAAEAAAEPPSSQTFEWTPPRDESAEPPREVPPIPLGDPAEETGSPFAAQAQAAAATAGAAERPELLVGAAFAGGMVAAKLLKRLGR